MDEIDFDDGDAMEIVIPIMPEQWERLRHYADTAQVSMARFLREGAEYLAAEIDREQAASRGQEQTEMEMISSGHIPVH